MEWILSKQLSEFAWLAVNPKGLMLGGWCERYLFMKAVIKDFDQTQIFVFFPDTIEELFA